MLAFTTTCHDRGKVESEGTQLLVTVLFIFANTWNVSDSGINADVQPVEQGLPSSVLLA